MTTLVRFSRIAGALAIALLVALGSGPARRLSAQNADSPLILISLDGFRWDYLRKAPAPAPALQRLVERGVRAEGLIPSFPTKTFPNHYTTRLVSGLERRGLATRTNIVVVSDHGMAATVPAQVIELDDYISLADVEVIDINPTLGLFPAAGKTDAVYRALAAAHPHLHVYRRQEPPEAWHYRQHRRIAPIVGVVDEGWQIVQGTVVERAVRTVRPPRGLHGYVPSVASMRGILIAAGPAFKQGVTVPAMENIHVYNVLATALGVRPAPNDGDMAVAKTLLRN